MTNILNVLVVKDEEGTLRPQAGIWTDNEFGQRSAEAYLKKDCLNSYKHL